MGHGGIFGDYLLQWTNHSHVCALSPEGAKYEYMDGRVQIHPYVASERLREILSKEQEMEMFLGTSAPTEYLKATLDVKPQSCFKTSLLGS